MGVGTQNGLMPVFPFERLETPSGLVGPSSQRHDNCTLLVRAMLKIQFLRLISRFLDLIAKHFVNCVTRSCRV